MLTLPSVVVANVRLYRKDVCPPIQAKKIYKGKREKRNRKRKGEGPRQAAVTCEKMGRGKDPTV